MDVIACETCIETHDIMGKAPDCANCPTPAMWRGIAVELEKGNARLRARLAAVKARCEANNWMGTARLCEEIGE